MMSDFIGYALIVNVKYFENEDDNREDTIDDQINTVRAFKELGFDTKLVTEDEDVNITVSRFNGALQEAIDCVRVRGYRHFAVFVSTHGEETRVGDEYIHHLSFYDGDRPTKDILLDPLDQQLRNVNKLILIQACRGRSDGEEYEDEDRGVPLDSNTCSSRPRPSTSENNTAHHAPLCIPNSVTMFASPSGKSAYQCILSRLFLESVQAHKPGDEVNVINLLRDINRQFVTEVIRLSDKYGDYTVYNIGSFNHSLTRYIKYTVRHL